ncbi:hypothetical protein NL108_010919 [Boleophthalmus pectinirostris]|nr:hypothetical protein NL108_010919 [Boleophthalmus pectinirostris]
MKERLTTAFRPVLHLFIPLSLSYLTVSLRLPPPLPICFFTLSPPSSPSLSTFSPHPSIFNLSKCFSVAPVCEPGPLLHYLLPRSHPRSLLLLGPPALSSLLVIPFSLPLSFISSLFLSRVSTLFPVPRLSLFFSSSSSSPSLPQHPVCFSPSLSSLLPPSPLLSFSLISAPSSLSSPSSSLHFCILLPLLCFFCFSLLLQPPAPPLLSLSPLSSPP